LGKINLSNVIDPQESLAKLDIYKDALAHVQSKGLAMPSLSHSGYKGEMPQDITSLDDDELGDLLNNISQYCGYADVAVSEAQSKSDIAKAQYETLYSNIRLRVKASAEGKMTDKDRSDMVNCTPTVVTAQAKMLYEEACYRLIRNIRDNAQRNWETISRRITQRGQEIDRMKRENSVAGIPASGRTFRRPGQ
jgi:hypothetical protein